MKKAWFILLTALAVIIIMSSGTLAIYSQTQTLRGQIYTRVFLFNADEKTTTYELGATGLALMPGGGEKDLYRFEFSNTDGNTTICDYLMHVSISSAGMSGALAGMDGLIFRLYDVSSEKRTPVATVTAGELDYSGIYFPAKTRRTIQYRLTAQWQETGNHQAQTDTASRGEKFPVKLQIKAAAVK